MYSVSEPETFLVEKVSADVGVASVTLVKIPAIRAVVVAMNTMFTMFQYLLTQ